MARIQILPLPLVTVGDATTEPFAIIIDEAESLGPIDELQANLRAFKDDCCASGVLVVEGRLDIVTASDLEFEPEIQTFERGETVRTISFPPTGDLPVPDGKP